MEELHKIIKKKYKEFDITPQHLGQDIRDNNITIKRSRHEHYPKERYGKLTPRFGTLIAPLLKCVKSIPKEILFRLKIKELFKIS